jgi:hypothetical protein
MNVTPIRHSNPSHISEQRGSREARHIDHSHLDECQSERVAETTTIGDKLMLHWTEQRHIDIIDQTSNHLAE